MENFNFAKTFMLGLEGIEKEIFEMLACFSFDILLWYELFINLVGFLLNYAETCYLNDFWFLLASNLS